MRDRTTANKVCQGEVVPMKDVRELRAIMDRRKRDTSRNRKEDMTCIAATLSRLLRLEEINPIDSTKTAKLKHNEALQGSHGVCILQQLGDEGARCQRQHI
jgi:hypothetical protein